MKSKTIKIKDLGIYSDNLGVEKDLLDRTGLTTLKLKILF